MDNALYKRLYDNIVNTINDKELTISSDSIFLTYVNKKQQELINILEPSTISMITLTNSEIESIDQEMIYYFPNDKISLSAKGIYNYEKNQNFISEDKLVEFFDKKWKAKLPKSASDSRLNIKEKLVVASMLASRAFSIDQCINTNDLMRLDSWYELFKEVNQSLLEKNFIAKSFESIDNPLKGNEKLISQMMRTIPELPQKTNLIVITNAEKPKHYYLNIMKDGEVDKDKLKYIIEVLTENNAEQIEALPEICNNIYDKYFSKVYENTLFSKFNYQGIIEKLALELLLD